MSKKHFKKLAEALKFSKPTRSPRDSKTARLGAYLAWVGCVNAVADACASDNPRFDRGRFYAACDYDPDVEPTVAA